MKVSDLLQYASNPLMIQVIDAERDETICLTSADKLFKPALSATLLGVGVYLDDDQTYLCVTADAIVYGSNLFLPVEEDE